MEAQMRAHRDFTNARRKAFWRLVSSRLTGQSNDLLPFDEVYSRLPVKGQRSLGLQAVAIDQIVGSVGRYRDFDRAFCPRQAQTRHRWVSVGMAMHQDVALPAVELYKVGEAYFVRDGNHRVSVAREMGQLEIDADVTEIDVTVPLAPDTDLDGLIVKQEYASFLEHTQLASVRPGAAVELTLPGQYETLSQHISTHGWYLGQRRDAEVSHQEAAASWYDDAYMPLVEIIRANGIIGEFPGRAEADLYLWIAEHRWYLLEAHGDVPLEQAAKGFAASHSRRPLKRAIGALRRAVRREIA